ncbi:hypothetical protein NKR23_g5179 [Pleurostoma richardsiae]|uniref:Putative gamma-glutamylcyclotransferase n=1 Tax=Pleurostoma richardsiae TaxID=41990 RepID=A0AA38RE98_9PEZI|nr:hypothetical protein NKR23_g5179 [Pleurostoma richardsiae]
MDDSTRNDGQAAKTSAASAFFYGTLMEPQIFYTVCYSSGDPPRHIKKKHAFNPAILHGYCRRRINDADYPGMIEDPDHSVRGTYVTGLTDDNIEKLDSFEGSDYERRKVKVRLLTKVGDDKGHGNEEGEEVTADTYIFLDKNELENKEWDFEEFRREKMQIWTRAGYIFDECDPNDPASVAAVVEETKEQAVESAV